MAKVRISRVSTGASLTREQKLAMFDAATRRQAARNRQAKSTSAKAGRGWTREELYERGCSR